MLINAMNAYWGIKMSEYKSKEHLPMSEVVKNKSYYAKLFSEGNSLLERLLMYCFNNGINTYMCSAGEEGENDAPYFALHVPYENKELIYNILGSIYGLEGTVIKLSKNIDNKDIFVNVGSFYGDVFFEHIHNGLQNINNKKNVSPDIANIVEILNKFNNSSYNLVFESNVISGGKRKYNVWLDYIVKEDRQIKYLYVFKEQYDYHNVIKLREFYNREALDEKASKIEENYIKKTRS